MIVPALSLVQVTFALKSVREYIDIQKEKWFKILELQKVECTFVHFSNLDHMVKAVRIRDVLISGCLVEHCWLPPFLDKGQHGPGPL